jgi:hypothetical protein
MVGLTLGDNVLEQPSSTEPAIIHHVKLVVGDAFRNHVNMMEVVFSSVGWGLVSSAWGASVRGIVCDNLDLHLILRLGGFDAV